MTTSQIMMIQPSSNTPTWTETEDRIDVFFSAQKFLVNFKLTSKYIAFYYLFYLKSAECHQNRVKSVSIAYPATLKYLDENGRENIVRNEEFKKMKSEMEKK